MKLYVGLLISMVGCIIACNDEDLITGYVQTKDIESSTIDFVSAIANGELKINQSGRGAEYEVKETGFLCSKYKELLKIHSLGSKNWIHDSTGKYTSQQVTEGLFTYTLTGLQPSAHYYARAYAIIHTDYSNDKGVLYKNILYGGIKEFITKDTLKVSDTIPDNPVFLDVPTGVTAHFLSWGEYSHIQVQWEEVSDAIVYEIWRSGQQDGAYILIGSSGPNYNQYEDGSPLIGNNHYKIKAVNGIYKSGFSNPAHCNFSLSNVEPCPPAITSITGDASALTVLWCYSTDMSCGTVSSFIVKKLNPQTGLADSLITTTDFRFIDTSVHPGLNQYWVIARNNHPDKASQFDISNEIPLDVPTGVKAVLSGKIISFSWDIVPEATGYQIFVSSSPNGSYTKIDETNSNTGRKDVVYPVADETRYFKVKAVWHPPYARPISGILSDFSDDVRLTSD